MNQEHESRMFRAALQGDSVLTAEEVQQVLPGATPSWVGALRPSGVVGSCPIYRWSDVLRAAGVELAPTPPDERWLDHGAAAARLGVSKRTLARAMQITPKDERPWVDQGTPAKPFYKWQASALDAWWMKVATWRQFANGERGGRSGGRTPTERPGAAASPRRKPPSSSNGRSKKRSPSADAGNRLKEFGRTL